MLATKENITRYIPQRPPMVMVNELLEVGNETGITQLTLEPDNIFIDKGFFAEPGLVENIAQTAAAHIGYQCVKRNIPVPVGYIAAIRDLKIYELPQQGSTITTSVRVINHVLNITIVEGKVEQGEKRLCSCEMRIFVNQS